MVSSGDHHSELWRVRDELITTASGLNDGWASTANEDLRIRPTAACEAPVSHAEFDLVRRSP